MIEIRPIGHASRNTEPNSLEVVTFPKPLDHSITLANITWVFVSECSSTWRNIVDREAINHDDAMRLATKFAQRYNIPVIFEKKAN